MHLLKYRQIFQLFPFWLLFYKYQLTIAKPEPKFNGKREPTLKTLKNI